jgi:hypothetical protein
MFVDILPNASSELKDGLIGPGKVLSVFLQELRGRRGAVARSCSDCGYLPR